ncbi:hypothetical protein [Sphingomonas kyeonggiensis]|uniref:Uncharacterized protein n=1 Tax=Sphingomonas kyeonggiensis TaxID=1268553 RepID=A0A7W6NZ53_9SPHN|nr:hypothetical protein [Sphingomonas kyeonggiensis]MBB4100461.1 hypothetical protein [Sphingomonas kyeonggiensis]
MRVTPWLIKIAILAAGIAIGAMTIVLTHSTSGIRADKPTVAVAPIASPSTGSSAELGSKLLQIVGRNLIADNRAMRHPDGPLLLFATPKPFGETLCRVDVYTVAPKIVRGQISEKERWDDDLKVETQYGLWKRPSLAGGDRDRACAAYRDFEHLIRDGSVLSVARAAFVMDEILAQAKTGKFGFQVTCTRFARDPNADPAPCDPVTVLRLLKLKDIYRAEQKSEVKGGRSYIRQDEILVAGSGLKAELKTNRYLFAVINVEDEQHVGRQSIDEADVRAVKIEISEVY